MTTTMQFRGKAGSRGALFLALFVPLLTPAISADVAERLQEYQLKAAFMFNFIQFIEWPAAALASPDAPFSICVMGKDPFGAALLALQKRNINGRPIAVAYPSTVAEARKCHMLYVNDPAHTALGADVGRALGDAPVLTVSSSTGKLPEPGIAIAFVQQSDKVRWTMNLDATRQAQLRVSAKLIEIAVAVIGEARR